MEPKKRGGKRAGAGAKRKDPSGELLVSRAMRWTHTEWADAKYIGLDRVREITRVEAARKRLGEPTNGC